MNDPRMKHSADMALRRKKSWKEQLSPKLKSFLGRKAKDEEKSPETETEGDFRIVHFPDRPPRRVKRDEIPSEDECRAMLLEMSRKSTDERRSPERVSPEMRSVMPSATKQPPRLQIPFHQDRIKVTGSKTTGTIGHTGRVYSPHPWVGQPKEVRDRMRRRDVAPNSLLRNSGYCPTSSGPSMPPVPPIPQQFRDLDEPARIDPRATLIRRPSRPEDALHSHPVHVRHTSAPSDGLCQICHIGMAEPWGICQFCSDECTLNDGPLLSAFPRPPTLTRPKANFPQNLNITATQHRISPSLGSNPEANFISPPSSPFRAVRAVVVTAPEPQPLTPLSAVPTPHLLARLEKKAEGFDNYYEERWPSQYFGNDVYEDERHDDEVDGYMMRELSLEEYDCAFASPVCPGPGWI